MEHIRQSRPDSGRDFQVKVLEIFQVVSSLLKSGAALNRCPKPDGPYSGDTTPCEVIPVILHGVVFRVTGVSLHRVVSPDVPPLTSALRANNLTGKIIQVRTFW
jgi:hypothetical protein